MCKILTQTDIIKDREPDETYEALKLLNEGKISREDYLRLSERALHASFVDDLLYQFRALKTIIPIVIRSISKLTKS